MFSVEDLLVSHGYRVSKNTLSSYQHRTDGYQHEATDSRSGSGMVNGFQPDPESFAANPTQTKGFFSDHEKSCVNKRRQIISAGYPKSNQSTEACHSSDAWVSDRLHPERPCWARTDKDIQYWRRRGQDFSVLLNHGDNGAPSENIILATDIEGKRSCNIIERNTKDCPNTIIENVEKVKKKVCQKTVEQQTSDGSSEKLDFISSSPEDGSFVGPNKQKSQLMPNVSPEGLCHMVISSTTGDNSFVKDNKIHSKDNYIAHQDCKKTPFSKPKYSRPSKPPSYEVHQQTWGAVDVTENQDNKQKDEHLSSPKVLDLSEESCFHDLGMEPPNYIPPPSYKSPPLLHAANKPFKKVPRSSDCIHQKILVEKTCTNDKKPICCLGNNGPFSKPANHRHMKHCKHFVQYIPFDDPRIKHIAVAQEAEKHNHSKQHNDIFRVDHTSQESSLRQGEQDSAFINPRNAGHHFVKREGIKHKQWLHISISDQICRALPENRDGATACSLPEDSETTHKLSLKKTHSDSACETVTKVKKFEPESFVFSKKSSKRKLNETIFCLVSIPVKSDSAPSDMCKNNNRLADNTDRMNMLKHSNGGLHEQRLLSASSSDLELQTLTGSMNNNTELLKQAQSKTEENKQANDLRSDEPKKHKELTYSGSWPGDQYKDQQTQTVCTDIQTTPLYNGTRESELHNKCTQSQFVPAGGLVDPRPAPENTRQNIFGIKGQMSFSPSSNSAFSRTSSLVTHIPRTEPCQRFEVPNVSVDGKEKKQEKNEMEDVNPCNKKEVFGQFLLKPVNRRPWDAISELESLNKEFQEPDSCANDGEKYVVKEQSRVIQMDVSTTRTAMRREMLNNNRHIIEVEEVPMFEVLQDQTKSQRWCIEKLMYDISEDSTELCKPSTNNEVINQPVKFPDRRLPGEIHVEVKSTGDAISTNAGMIAKTDQGSPIHANKMAGDKKQSIPDAGFHHFKEDKTCFDHTFFDVVKVSSAKFGQIGDNMLRKLSLADRNHGRSVPDLSKHCISTSRNGDFYEEHNYLDIPENESLHDRAARILGIDVADDCLVSNGSSEAQSPENVTSGSGIQPEKSTRGKLSEISFSTKETLGILKSVLHMPFDNERAVEKLKNGDQVQKPSFACQSLSEQNETNISRSAEKRVRNTSKMIETLQGKLASTPVRTAVDRLARMKEVDSVSRMRRLSIKSTDSGDEFDEEKHGVQDGRTRKFSTGTIYKRVISLDESLLITAKGKEKLDLSCADAYDPARVERV
ncbi:junctional cadherin 5-associated protein isoform X2 [Pseudophryne corroboree]|uniref:junctional cadherin 5-associated protein isoform X2 n=1 Tax=Pseudophryne corroboree TaxID=495146 RepID=UPI00308194AD